MNRIRIPEVKRIAFIQNSINLSDLNGSTFSHYECSTKMINKWTEEETRILHYNTNPKSAIRYISRWEIDIFGHRTNLLSDIKSFHIFNNDGSEDMFRL
jgi:hypothetical protein